MTSDLRPNIAKSFDSMLDKLGGSLVSLDVTRVSYAVGQPPFGPSPFASAPTLETKLTTLTTMSGTNTSSTPVDFSRHINKKSRARHPSPLKDIIKFMGYDGMISLAGGMLMVSRTSSYEAKRANRTAAPVSFPT